MASSHEVNEPTARPGLHVLASALLVMTGMWCACQTEETKAPNAVRAAALGSCEQFATSLCSKQSVCLGTHGTAACVADAVGPKRFDCASVTGISANFDQCLADIPMTPCPLTVPGSCKDILTYGSTPAAGTGTDAGGGKSGSSYRCDAGGSYKVCPSRTSESSECKLETVTYIGLGATEAIATADAMHWCLVFVNQYLTINNVAGYAYLVAPCMPLGCRRL
jgi:hypothetical protein